MRLLLIEDEYSAVDLTKRLLGDMASRIDDAATLDDAFRLMRERDYDVVILDLRLVNSDRDETVEQIPRIKKAANAPVIVATGWPDPDIRQKCLDAGADAFVSKNELTTGILMAVDAVLKNAPDKSRAPSFADHVALLQRVLQHA